MCVGRLSPACTPLAMPPPIWLLASAIPAAFLQATAWFSEISPPGRWPKVDLSHRGRDYLMEAPKMRGKAIRILGDLGTSILDIEKIDTEGNRLRLRGRLIGEF